MENLKLKDLKKYLKEKSDTDLINEIVELVKLYPNVKEYYKAKLIPQSEVEIFQKYKKIIENEFFPDRGFGKLRYSNVNKAIIDYKKLSTNTELIAKLMFCYPEVGIKFTREYGDIDEKFYEAIERAYINALEYVHKNDLQEIFVSQAHELKVKSQDIGWGFSDNMADIYYEYYYDDIY